MFLWKITSVLLSVGDLSYLLEGVLAPDPAVL